MKIYYQLNDNDCGISVTQSLVHHFFKREISKEELYQESNIKDEGISILDLEKLNSKFGISLKSYSMTFQEFLEYSTKKYFLLVINRNGIPHYSIAKKNTKRIILFDSYFGKISYKLQDFQKFWMNIFISVESTVSSTPPYLGKFLIKRDEIDFRKVAVFFFVNLVVLFFSIVNSYLSRYNVAHIYNNYDFFNLLKILFINALVLLVFFAGELVESWIIFDQKTNLIKSQFRNLISSLINKKNSYLQKLGKNQFLMIRNHIYCISEYHSEYLNKWFTSVFTCLLISIILLCISPYFLIFIVVSLLVQFLFWNLSRHTYLNYLPKLHETQNLEKRIINSIESFLKNEINAGKLSSLICSFNSNLDEEWKTSRSLFWKQTKFSKFNAFLTYLLYLLVFAFVSFHVFSGVWNVGHLISLSLFHHHLNKSMENLAGYYGFKSRYLYSKNIYSQFLNVDLFQESKEHSVYQIPRKINIKNLFYSSRGKIIFQDLNLEIIPNTIICGPSGSGKTVLYKLMVQKLIPSLPSIYFDDVPISEFESSYFRDMCIYQGSDSYLDMNSTKFRELINNLPDSVQIDILRICQAMNLDVENIYFDGLSSGQRQLMNILSLLECRNKLLFLDEVASNINLNARIMVYKTIISRLTKENFVVCSEHSPEIFSFFENRIDLCSIS